MKIQSRTLLLPCFIALLYLSACGTESARENKTTSADSVPVRGDWVRVYLPADPILLNPMVGASLYASQVCDQIFQSLTTLDPQSYEPLPLLASKLPVVLDSGRTIIYELRGDAKWDDGKPITTKDIEFSFKVGLCPSTDNGSMRSELDFLSDVRIDSPGVNTIVFRLRYPYFRALATLGSIPIFQQSHYDPDNLLGKFSTREIIEAPEKFSASAEVKKFSESFHSEKYGREISFVNGSGPYQVEEWVSNSRIVLKRKPNWWANELGATHPQFAAWPEKIIYKIIADPNTAVAALKSGELDLMSGIPANIFSEETQNKGPLLEQFFLRSQSSFNFSFLTFHCRPSPTRPPFFTDKKVRRAIAHLVDADLLIENIFFGMGERIFGPISSLKTNEIHPNLKPVEYNPGKAKQLLTEAGWKDSDADGILDKTINGKKIKFAPQLLYSGSKSTEGISLQLKKTFLEAGIELELKPMELSQRTEKEGRHDFDLSLGAMAGSHLPTTLNQMWETENYVRGNLNISGFGNAETDSLIEKIQTTYDTEERKSLYFKFQEIIYEEQPAVFLFAFKERIALHRRFRNFVLSNIRPYYNPAFYWVPANEQKFK